MTKTIKIESKISKLKQAIKNPPAERLAQIEYRSHLYQAFGIAAVCIILITKGFWYIIFAFIFGIGVSYSQGMSAYKKYETIMSFKMPEKLKDYERDISPTRRRSKIINSVIPFGKMMVSLISTLIALYVIDPHSSRWILMILYPVTIGVFFSFIYFFPLYWIAYPFYKKKLREEKK